MICVYAAAGTWHTRTQTHRRTGLFTQSPASRWAVRRSSPPSLGATIKNNLALIACTKLTAANVRSHAARPSRDHHTVIPWLVYNGLRNTWIVTFRTTRKRLGTGGKMSALQCLKPGLTRFRRLANEKMCYLSGGPITFQPSPLLYCRHRQELSCEGVQELIRRWDSERQRFTTTSYM